MVEAENGSEHGTEMYSLEDLPRIMALNNEEVQSIDSALLSAEEQDLIDSSSADLEMSSGRGRYMKNHGGMLIAADDAAGRRISTARRISAVSAARKMSHTNPSYHHHHSNPAYRMDDHSVHSDHRRISTLGGTSYDPQRDATPSTLRRNVSAFGEITVMPVGDNEDEDLRVTVEEEIYH